MTTNYQVKIFKLIVQPSINCLELLRYLNKNIEEVNTMGVGIKIEKISGELDENLVEIFRQKGITRLPALIAPEGKVFIGLQQVVNLFEKNLSSVKNTAKASPVGYELDESGYSHPQGTDLTTYMQRLAFDGIEKDTKGRILQPKDKDDDTAEESIVKGDLDRRMMAFNRKTKNRRNVDDEQDLDDPMPRNRRTTIPTDEDNIADDTPTDNIRIPNGQKDDMDDRMMNAWLKNNVQDSD